MAWTNPRSWVAGEVLTASTLNTHLRDNLLAISANPALEIVSTVSVTADYTLTDTVTEVTGLSVAVTGSNTATIYVCHISLDVDFVVGSFVAAQLFVDGSSFGPTLNLAMATGQRSALTKTIAISGLATGAHTFSVRANKTGSAGAIVRQSHSTLLVDVRT